MLGGSEGNKICVMRWCVEGGRTHEAMIVSEECLRVALRQISLYVEYKNKSISQETYLDGAVISSLMEQASKCVRGASRNQTLSVLVWKMNAEAYASVVVWFAMRKDD